MQKLTLKRRASGIHAVLAPDGEPLGVINPADLDLNDDELGELMNRHAQKRVAQGAVAEFLKRIREHMDKTGADYKKAMHEVALADPELAAEQRAEQLGTHLL